MSVNTTGENPDDASQPSEDGAAPSSKPGEPVQGGRRLGDDPFLADEGLFWWLPRSFSLLVVAVAFMLLGAHFFGNDSDTSSPKEATKQVVAPAAPAVPAPVAPAPAAPAVVERVVQRPALPVVQTPVAAPNQLERGRSYNARRRLLLQEAEVLLRSLPVEGTGSLESDRDRRALRDFIQRMDTPAR